MNENQNVKYANCLTDQTKDNDSFTAAAIDTAGFDAAEIACVFQNVPANVAALKVTECETSGGVYTDVTGAIVGTSNNIDGSASALPTAAAGDDTNVIFQLDLRKRKRYLKLVATAGNGGGTATELTAVCRLSRAKVAPTTSAGQGAAQVLCV